MHPRDQTIFALSSGRPPSAIAIVRISGPSAQSALKAIVGRLPEPRRAQLATLRDGEGQPIDQAVVLWLPGPASFTGEDSAEFHIHGSRAVLETLAATLGALPDMRAAEPGEFTRRGFENGKLDLTEAEGLDDLIHADTDQQRRQALRQLQGMLGDRVRDWRQRLIDALALIEASIDFSDESDVPEDIVEPALDALRRLRDEIQEVLAAQGRSERLRDGLVIAITGPPNVGKSTLMNRLARREVSIVSAHAGTTRDVIEVQMSIDGYPVTVIDTAGLRESDDPVEQEGVRRAMARAASADLRLWVSDDEQADGSLDSRQENAQGAGWVVRNKVDDPAKVGRIGRIGEVADPPQFAVSALNGAGIGELVDGIGEFAKTFFAIDSGLMTRARHRQLLEEAVDGLNSVLAEQRPIELVADDVRKAAATLGKVLGRVDIEEILDSVFRNFCIGK